MALKKSHFFALIVALVPVLFFLLLEAGLRAVDYGGNLALFVPASHEYAEDRYLAINPDITQRYFPGDRFIPRPSSDVFLKVKPGNGYRVFVLGGSTVAGWPYPDNVMFSRRLQQLLAATFPERTIEVISLGIAAVNSYTLRDFIDEVLDQQADAVLIYAGHNEYYGALGAASTVTLPGIGDSGGLIRLYLWLQHSRLFRLLGDALGAARHALQQAPPGNGAEQPRMTLMGRVIGEHDIAEHSETYERGLKQFGDNLRAVLNSARDAGVPVLVSELVSNVRDQPPFFFDGEAADSDAARAWRRARELDSDGEPQAARAFYERAKDLDGLRFRAPEAMNRLIHTVAAESGTAVVPMKSRFEAAAPQGLIGDTLILDHLHPNAGGYLLMARAFYDSMRELGLISTQWPEPAESTESEPYTELDTAIGKLRAMSLKDNWPFRPLDSPGKKAIAYQPADMAESYAQQIVRETITYAAGHLQLARYYHNQGEHQRALLEYRALINNTPHRLTPYLATVTALAQAKRYRDASGFLTQAEAVAPGHPALARLMQDMPAPMQQL